MFRRLPIFLLLAATLTLTSGCSIRSMAANTVGDMLASGDASVFDSEDDLELIAGALPFSIKLVESLLAEVPQNRGLLLTATRSYMLYSNVYIHTPADQIAAEDLEHARQLRARARKLYLRAFDYAMRGVELDYPGLGAELRQEPVRAVARIDGDGANAVPFLYWSASALGLAISVSKRDMAMVARLPEVEALLARALELDEAYDEGALHEFAVIWGGANPGTTIATAIDRHYARALELSAGRRPSLYVAYALAQAVPNQDRKQFTELMQEALAIDPDIDPDSRLLTTISQNRAHWLLAHEDELFLE